jgi:voltage-gated potassium channel
MNKLKQKIYETIEEDISDNRAHKLFEVFIVSLIILNVAAIIIESFLSKSGIPEYLIAEYTLILKRFEVFSVIVFSIEYLLRVWTAQLKYPEYSKIKASFKFIFSAAGLIDLMAILPFFIDLRLHKDLDGRIVRLLKLLRLLRILKLTRFLDSFKLITNVIKNRKYELLITIFVALMFIVIASTIMFELENKAQPDKFPNIISALWWSVATLTTIGYGDVFPITALGKCVSALLSLVGIGLIALPTGIISSGFLEEYRNSKQNECDDECSDEETCPHCGKVITKAKV